MGAITTTAKPHHNANHRGNRGHGPLLQVQLPYLSQIESPVGAPHGRDSTMFIFETHLNHCGDRGHGPTFSI